MIRFQVVICEGNTCQCLGSSNIKEEFIKR